MNPTALRLAARHYLLGLFSASWNGGIGAVAAIFGIDGASLSGLSSEARVLNWHEMVSAFVGAFVVSGIFWLKAHPLPENWATVAPWGPAAGAEVDKGAGVKPPNP